MMHQDVQRAADQAPSGFAALWLDVVPLFTRADLAFANLETPVAPRTGRKNRAFVFNAPADLPAALRQTGLSIISTANNHAFDQGPAGVRETLERLRAEKLLPVGSGLTRAEAESAIIAEHNGIKVAFLAFTDLLNANRNQRPNEPWVRVLDIDSATEAVSAARRLADAVVVSVHWGHEYSHAPTIRQREAAQRLVAAGCDLILGHHPHVLQPVEWVEAGNRQGLVAYSLGNFISNQDRSYHATSPIATGDSRDGVALIVTFTKAEGANSGGTATLERVDYEPLWTENNWRAWKAGKAKRRDIHVMRINAALAKSQPVAALAENLGKENSAQTALAAGARANAALNSSPNPWRILRQRQERIASILGKSVAAQ